MTVQCCSCKKIRDGKQWVDARESELPAGEGISHGYCPVCATRAFAAIRQELMLSRTMTLKHAASS